MLNKEQQEKKFYIDLLLSRAGIIKNEERLVEELGNLPTINRFVTLSAIRREAERKSREKLAKKEDLTEAEAKFQEELNKVS